MVKGNDRHGYGHVQRVRDFGDGAGERVRLRRSGTSRKSWRGGAEGYSDLDTDGVMDCVDWVVWSNHPWVLRIGEEGGFLVSDDTRSHCPRDSHTTCSGICR